MTHEPECLPIRRYTMNGEPRCDCGIARAAYQRGFEFGYGKAEDDYQRGYERGLREGAEVGIRNGESMGYTRGYNEAMRLHKNLDVMDWVYGYNQHGKGENP